MCDVLAWLAWLAWLGGYVGEGDGEGRGWKGREGKGRGWKGMSEDEGGVCLEGWMGWDGMGGVCLEGWV